MFTPSLQSEGLCDRPRITALLASMLGWTITKSTHLLKRRAPATFFTPYKRLISHEATPTRSSSLTKTRRLGPSRRPPKALPPDTHSQLHKGIRTQRTPKMSPSQRPGHPNNPTYDIRDEPLRTKTTTMQARRPSPLHTMLQNETTPLSNHRPIVIARDKSLGRPSILPHRPLRRLMSQNALANYASPISTAYFVS